MVKDEELERMVREDLNDRDNVGPIEDAIREQQDRIADLGPEEIPERIKRKRNPIVTAVLVLVTVPSGLFVILSPLAYMGIYVEPLRQFWRPWANGPEFLVLVFGLFVTSVVLATRRIGSR